VTVNAVVPFCFLTVSLYCSMFGTGSQMNVGVTTVALSAGFTRFGRAPM
jgi:hypothetical protein